MGAERVVLEGTTPVVVYDMRAVSLWADTVTPMIIIGEATAWPAHYRNLELLECLEYVLSVTIDIWNL